MALLMLCLMLLFFAMSIPIAISMGLTAFIVLIIRGIPLTAIPQRMVLGIDSFALLAVPLFLMAGQLMNTGGIAKRIFDFARALVGHWKGGLGHVNVIASMIFAGMSGSAVADAGGLGVIEIKEMLDDGYDLDFSAAITAASSTIGPIIPPSVPMVLYGVMAEVSIGGLFLGGFIPGLLMGFALMALISIISHRKSYPSRKRASIWEVFRAFRQAFLALLAPLIIIGGIVGGVFTPTEAAGIAVLYSLFLGFFIYREITIKDFLKVLLETGVSTGILMFIVGIASLLGWLIAREGIPKMIIQSVLAISSNPRVILLMINILLLLLGCFMETASIMLILIPILVPLVTSVGVNPLHFGVVMVLNLMIGLLTPPVGLVLYTVSNVAQVSFTRVARATAPFLIPLITVLLLITNIPELVLFIPRLILR